MWFFPCGLLDAMRHFRSTASVPLALRRDGAKLYGYTLAVERARKDRHPKRPRRGA